MIPELPPSETIFRLFLALFLGGAIGFERQRLSWAAGLRTHMLVCIGSALIMIVSQYGFKESLAKEYVMLDPSRVAAQVVSGIGFLGAGTILFLKNTIKGLTTAASLWVVAGVGLGIGGGLYIASVTTTFFVLVVLAGIKPLERRFLSRPQANGIRLSAKPGTLSLVALEKILTHLSKKIKNPQIQIEKTEESDVVFFLFSTTNLKHTLKTIDELRELPGVDKVEVINDSINFS